MRVRVRVRVRVCVFVCVCVRACACACACARPCAGEFVCEKHLLKLQHPLDIMIHCFE